MEKSNLLLSDEQTINTLYIDSDPTLSSNTPPPLGGIKPVPVNIKPVPVNIKPKTDLLLQSDVLPVDSPYAQDLPIKMTCEEEWNKIAMTSRFSSEVDMLKAKEDFMNKCLGVKTSGASQMVEPDLGLPTNTAVGNTNIGAFMGSISGGAGGNGGATETEDVALIKDKKPFPYWILIAVAVGGYLVFRKK